MRLINSLLCVLILTLCVGAIRCGDTGDTYRDRYSDLETTTDGSRNSMICMDIKPQHSLNIEHIMGMWYGVEIIMHTQDVPGIYRYDTCVIIHLSDVTQQMQGTVRDYNYRRTSLPPPTTAQQREHRNGNAAANAATKYLRLVWTERDDNLEYNFNYTEHSPGLWTNVGEQRGSLVALNKYQQFEGSLQVVKAVNDHLVLTFCGNDVKSSIYTIVLSRNPLGLSSEELRSIRNLLSRRGLYTETIRKVCNAATAVREETAALLTLLLGVVTILRKYFL